jgi:hypothetical protein
MSGTIIIDGRTRVSFLTACASIAAPTTTELNAGTALELLIRPDGLQLPVEQAFVNNGSLGSKMTTNRVGRYGVGTSAKIGFHHVSTSDTAWLLAIFRTTGFIVVRMGIDRTTAWATGDKAKVYPVEFGEFNDVPPTENSNWDFEVPIAVTDDFNQRAVVA